MTRTLLVRSARTATQCRHGVVLHCRILDWIAISTPRGGEGQAIGAVHQVYSQVLERVDLAERLKRGGNGDSVIGQGGQDWF